MGHREEWIDPETGEKLVFEDVIENYTPTDLDRKEVDRFNSGAQLRMFSRNKTRRYRLTRKRKGHGNI